MKNKIIITQFYIKMSNIFKNIYGNYEHKDTNLIFCPISYICVGKQNENGNVDKLTHEDINMCDIYMFDYDKNSVKQNPVVIKKINQDLYIHEDTKLVINPNNRKVIGIYTNNKINKLSAYDIHNAIIYKFKYDETCVKNGEQEVYNRLYKI